MYTMTANSIGLCIMTASSIEPKHRDLHIHCLEITVIITIAIKDITNCLNTLL